MAGYLVANFPHVCEFLNAKYIPVKLDFHQLQPPHGTSHRNSTAVPADDDSVVAGRKSSLWLHS
eukprot:8539060-Pyramimonas_sp.AAC.1